MKDYEYILQQAKKAHYSNWTDEELRKCVDMLPKLSRQELIYLLYQQQVVGSADKLSRMPSSTYCSMHVSRKGDKKIKAMNVDELIENLHDENGYGKFIVLEMKERYDSLDFEDKVKIIDTLSATTKANQNWAEGKKKKLNKEEQ